MATTYETYVQGQGDGFLRDLSTPALPVDLPIGVIADFKLSNAIETLSLPTQNVMDEAGSVINVKATGSLKMGGTYAAQLKAFTPGATKTAGMKVVKSETKAAAASFVLTSVTGFVNTLAVRNQYGAIMGKVAATPTASTATVPGTYIDLGTGSYTMAAGESGNVTVQWVMTDAAVGFTISPVNVTQGSIAPFLELTVAFKASLSDGTKVDETIIFPKIQVTKVETSAAPKKNAEWDLDFVVYCDAAGKPWYRSIKQ